MPIYFEGTSTGNRYEVGRDYVNSRGQVVTANIDGSFGSPRDSSWSQGSAGNSDVNWYASGSDVAYFGDGRAPVYGSPAADAQDHASRLPNVSAAAAPAGTVSVPNPTFANRGAFIRDAAWSGKDDPGQDNLMAGIHWRANPRATNGAMWEERYGEVGEMLIGLAVLGSDIGYNARIWADANGYDNGRGVSKAIERGVQPDVVGGALASARDWLQGWAAENKAAERAAIAREDEANDLIDYKLYLNGLEGQRSGDYSAVPPPNVW